MKLNPNYMAINAEDCVSDNNSIFWFYNSLITLRKNNPVLVYGDYTQTDNDHSQLFSYLRRENDEQMHVLLNFSDELCDITDINLDEFRMILINQTESKLQHDYLLPWEARIYQLEKDS